MYLYIHTSLLVTALIDWIHILLLKERIDVDAHWVYILSKLPAHLKYLATDCMQQKRQRPLFDFVGP